MYYYIYQITNNTNGKVYVGKHKTKNLNDGYFGSGKILKSAIKKYGKESFTKEILFEFGSEQELNDKEKELVTEEFCLRDDTYNLCVGGQGGFSYINREGLSPKNKSIQGRKVADKALLEKYGPEWRIIISKRGLLKKDYLRATNPEWAAREKIYQQQNIKMANANAHTETARARRKQTYKQINHQQGEKNSSFGKVWIKKDVQCLMVPKTELDAYLDKGYIRGRIYKKKV